MTEERKEQLRNMGRKGQRERLQQLQRKYNIPVQPENPKQLSPTKSAEGHNSEEWNSDQEVMDLLSALLKKPSAH